MTGGDDGLSRRIVDATETGLAVFDQDGRALVWNRWLAWASGIPPSGALGDTLAGLFPELAGTRLTRALADATERGLSSLVSSALNRKRLPLFRDGRQPIEHVVVVKPMTIEGRRCCLAQVTDVTSAAARELLLRRQARTTEALAESYRLSELQIRAIVDSTADAVVTFDRDGAIGTYNPAAERIFGYAPAEVVTKGIGLLMPELAPAPGSVPADSYMAGRREIDGRRKDGGIFPLELSVGTMELGGRRLYIGIAHDITLRKRAEADLRTQKEWLSTLVNALPDLVCLQDEAGRWLVTNQLTLALYQLTGIDYRGKTTAELARLARRHGDMLAAAVDSDRQACADGRPLAFEQTLTLADGATKTFDMLKVPVFHADGRRKGLVAVGRDITDRKQTAERIQHLAHHDSLTDLPNRVLFQDRLRNALAQARRRGDTVALMFLDLDKFKDVNDVLGHHVGDLLLKAVARRLSRCVRESDTVARLGGDEFAVLLTNVGHVDGVTHVAEAIIRGIAEPFGLDGNEVTTSTSIGITVFPGDAEEPELLLRNADLALYRSKAEGRNNYHFYVAEMDAEVQARKAVERDLRQAMESDELMLYYQPLIDMRSGAITGAEALIRWNHAQRGFVSPALFIPIAERTDLIFPLGRWVIDKACRQMAEWRRAGLPPLVVAVNLSAAQFKHRDLLATVREIIAANGVDPTLLQLEITESIAMHNIEGTIEVLNQLRAMGLHISIDDFGTGYSSLNYLKRFPVDKLKIDRSFVTDIGLHPDNAAIVRTIISLGHGIGTKVNVEGVETWDQLEFLHAHDVDEAQGFLFSKPLPPADFIALVTGPRPWRMPGGGGGAP